MTASVIVVAALVLILVIWQTIQITAIRRKVDAVPEDGNTVAVLRAIDERTLGNAASIESLSRRLGDVEIRLPHALSRMAVVEYDAFGNISGNQSRSIALLNEQGDGLVVSLLTYRDTSVFYTKEVRAASGVQELSPEEQGSVDRAMGR